MKYKILFLALITSIFSWGQATLPVSRTIWDSTPTGWSDTPLDSYTSTFACSGSNGAKFDTTNASKIVNFTGTPSQLTFTVKSNTATTSSLLVEESSDGISYTTVINLSGSTDLPTTCTVKGAYSLLTTSSFVRWTFTKGSSNMTMDDVSITSGSPIPTITLTPTSLSGFAYVVGSGPSAEQSFTVSGTNLTTNVVLTAPTNYQISTTSGSGFVNSIALPFGSGTLASTTIYVRLNSGLSVNSYTGNITADSTGAAQKTVALSGNVTGSTQSDIVAVAGSEAATISSTINNAAPLTAATGIQVWQFKVRDGGATLNDSDNLPTVLTAFTIAQFANTATTWSNAINTIALFDGSTFIASGTVTANQIQFTGLNVSVADNTEKTLSLRLSLKCPLGVGIFDNDRFGFSISNANTTFSPTGSGKVAFSAIQNTSGTNLIQVVGTQLSFLVQPITTGVNGPMSPAVKVRTLDACGNFDSNFTGTISITSTGTLAFSPVSAVAVNGVATFSSLTHTVSGTGYVLNATSSGLTGATSTTFNIDNVTVLQPGDIAILAFNTGIATGEDEISFVTLVDMLPGTRIDITDNAYQKCGTPNGWGISEGWIRLERANTVLPKGTIVTVRIDGTGLPSVFSPDPTNWIYSKPQPASQGTFNLNNFGEQIFFMSGGNVGGPNATTASSDAGIYSGNFLFGFNTKGNVWTPVCGNSAAGGTQNSDKPINFDCFLTWPTAQADLNKYTGLMTPATKRDWIERINNPSNWTGYVDNTAYDAGPNFYGQSITINAGGFTDGIWIGSSSNNWFECGNWQSLKVPDENVNVILDSNSVQKVKIDSTAPFSDLYADIAKCRNLSVSNFSVELLSDINNVLYVYGDLSISGVGSINMNDGNNSSNDGIIKLFGNWTNNVGLSAFDEGNGTVEFLSGTTQVINNNVHTNTEEFYNVVLDNNFNTFLSNNLIAKGNLEVKANRVFTIATNDYAFAYKKLTNNGSISIGNNGQFIQVDEIDTNDGNYSGTKFQVNRTAQAKNFDYVYWSAPTESFPISSLPTNNRYEWSTLFPNTNGTFGNWILPSTATMTKGQGYIARASNGAVVPTALATTFVGKPNNGQFTLQIYRGNYTGPDYDADLVNPTNLWTTAYDDNWNLLGNPYPSAIDAMEFINLNTASNNVKMVGAIWVWKHGIDPTSNISPFYQNFTYNYSTNDYIKFNAMGSSEPTLFTNGKIASGQAFMINMSDELSAGVPNPSGNSITFNNDLRTDASKGYYNNTDFFRPSNALVQQPEERHRMWLDIFNTTSGQLDRTLLGYATNATLEADILYDCFTRLRSEVSLYSLINNKPYAIQGRPLPFNAEDIVPMGISIVQPGNHTIAINTVDGLFAQNQDIYLEDKLLNVIHDLKQAPYNFTSDTGVFNDRFVIRYTNLSLSTNTNNLIDNNVVVVTNHDQVTIKSVYDKMKSVVIYDVLGREIVKKDNLNVNEVIFNSISAKNQALIVKIELENDTVVTRKIIL